MSDVGRSNSSGFSHDCGPCKPMDFLQLGNLDLGTMQIHIVHLIPSNGNVLLGLVGSDPAHQDSILYDALHFFSERLALLIPN